MTYSHSLYPFWKKKKKDQWWERRILQRKKSIPFQESCFQVIDLFLIDFPFMAKNGLWWSSVFSFCMAADHDSERRAHGREWKASGSFSLLEQRKLKHKAPGLVLRKLINVAYFMLKEARYQHAMLRKHERVHIAIPEEPTQTPGSAEGHSEINYLHIF